MTCWNNGAKPVGSVVMGNGQMPQMAIMGNTIPMNGNRNMLFMPPPGANSCPAQPNSANGSGQRGVLTQLNVNRHRREILVRDRRRIFAMVVIIWDGFMLARRPHSIILIKDVINAICLSVRVEIVPDSDWSSMSFFLCENSARDYAGAMFRPSGSHHTFIISVFLHIGKKNH